MTARTRIHVLGWGACLLLTGCLGRTPTPRLYVLTPLGAADAAVSDLVIGVGPVTIPEYLNRPEIVTRGDCSPPPRPPRGCCGLGEECGELRLSESDRWAEPLEGNLTRVLAENLSLLLGTERVVRYPWRPATPLDYQVRLDVVRLDVASNGQVVLTVRWSVVGKDGALAVVKRSEYRDSVTTDEDAVRYGPTVSALSRRLAELSREIAEVLKTKPRSPQGGSW